MALMYAPFLVDVYRRAVVGQTEYQEDEHEWSRVHVDVPMDIQPIDGSVVQHPYGRVVQGRYQGFVDAIELRVDDGVIVRSSAEDASWVGRRFVVVGREASWGSRGGVQPALDDTVEAFG